MKVRWYLRRECTEQCYDEISDNEADMEEVDEVFEWQDAKDNDKIFSP